MQFYKQYFVCVIQRDCLSATPITSSGVYCPPHVRKRAAATAANVTTTHVPGIWTANNHPPLPLPTLPPPRRRWIANGRYPTSSHELYAWLGGREHAISAEAASDHGMDLFWYTMLMRPRPTDDNILALYARLWQLLESRGPAKLAKEVSRGTLIKCLGLEFGWVVLPIKITEGPLSIITGWPSPSH